MTYRRGWIALLIFSAVIINYIDRIALSVAAKPIVAEFGFTPVQMGYLFSGFLWTYVVCLIPLGLVVERIGAKRMVGGGIAIWSTATALTAAASGFVTILAAGSSWGRAKRRRFRPADASSATGFPNASAAL
jgi:MFS family permease